MMVNLEDARKAFNAFPDKALREWGEEWNMSHENVRLMKIKFMKESFDNILSVFKTISKDFFKFLGFFP